MSIHTIKNILWAIIGQKTPKKIRVSSLEVIEKKPLVIGCAKFGRIVMKEHIEAQRLKIISTNF